jgi:hypothetical protein
MWIIATYLIATSSKGISSLKLASLLGLQYRTTWHLAHRIRAMMDSHPDLLRGIVDLDETEVGGKPRATNKPEPPAPIPLFEEPKEEPEQKPKKRHKGGRGTDKPMAFTAESVHALFKRGYVGVCHWISGKHTGRYLREVELHWNHL